jgi:hypothetical protein
LKKQKQKNLATWSEPLRQDRSPTSESFLLLFFKKEGLSRLSACLAPWHRPDPSRRPPGQLAKKNRLLATAVEPLAEFQPRR